MAASSIVSSAMAVSSPSRPAPRRVVGPLAWMRDNLFSGTLNTIFTLLCLWLLASTVPAIVRWTLLDAVWTSSGDAASCKATSGACWAVVQEKYRLILFGTYPYDQHWRGAIVIVLLIAMSVISGFRRFWSRKLLYLWTVTLALVLVLQTGGVLGLVSTPTHLWGGLPLTLLMFFGTIIGGLPLAVLVALGRQSDLPVVKALCIGFIEVIRGVPLVSVLFMTALIFPLFVPEALTPNKLIRAQLGMLIFFAAYAAEIFRGGLQAMPKGQYEAANAIGLSYWQKTRRVILPQTIRTVLPALMNDVIRAFKNTTFIAIVGLFDILGATRSALQDPSWVSYSAEAYLFVTTLYFCVCFSMSKYSQSIEHDLKTVPRK